MTPGSSAAPRDGRLTYTSVDTGAGSGGWQVREEHDLSEQDRRRALELVATAVEPVQEPSRFPSVAEVAALPRRLVVGTSGTSTLLVHSVPAGPDASRRPGNVFNHVVVLPSLADRLLADPDAPRPVQLWRSPDWRCPYGAEAVRDARLPAAVLPAPGDVVTRGTVAALLAAPGSADVLGALADAVDQALGDGPPVVVLVDDQDSAVLALGAVALLLSPAECARLTFSTWERGYAVRAAERLPHVTLVPRGDAGQLQGTVAVVLDLAAQQPAGEAGWPTAVPGRTVPRGPLSGLLAGLCGQPPQDTAGRLAAVAAIAAADPDVSRGWPRFPLALAVAEWDLPGSALAADLLWRVPSSRVRDPESRDVLSRLRASGPPRSAAQWAELVVERTEAGEQDPGGPEPLDDLVVPWLRQLLSEPGLVHGAWPPALPGEDTPLSAQGRRDLAGLLQAALAQLLPQPLPPDQTAVALLRVLDLLALLDLHGSADLQALAAPAALAVALLADPQAGPAALASVGPVQPATARLLVPALQEQVAAHPDAPVGARLPAHLAAWAHAQLAPAVLDGTLPVRSPLGAELHVAGVPPLAAWDERRVDVVLQLVDEWSRTAPGADRADLASNALEGAGRSGRAWTAAEVVRLLTEVPAEVADVRPAARPLLEDAEPGADPDVVQLARLLREGSGATDAADLDEALHQLAVVHTSAAPADDGRTEDQRLADLVVSGLAYTERTAPGAADRLAPHVLAAALRLHARGASRGTLDSGRVRRLDAHLGHLNALVPHLPEALPLLLTALADEREAAGVLHAVAALVEPEPYARPRDPGLWLVPLDPPAAVRAGRGTVGEAVLHAYLATLDDPREWLDRTLAATTRRDDERLPRLRAWGRTLLDPAPLPALPTAPPVERQPSWP